MNVTERQKLATYVGKTCAGISGLMVVSLCYGWIELHGDFSKVPLFEDIAIVVVGGLIGGHLLLDRKTKIEVGMGVCVLAIIGWMWWSLYCGDRVQEAICAALLIAVVIARRVLLKLFAKRI